MDRIEQLMKAAKPRTSESDRVAGNDAVRSIILPADPDVLYPAGTTPGRRAPVRRTAARTAAGAVLAAAAVAGAVVVGGSMMPQPVPAPAGTGTAPAATAGPAATPTPAPSLTASTGLPVTASTAPASNGTATPETGGVACTMDNVDLQRSDQQRAILPIPADEQKYYTVLGCAGGWLAFSISDEGARAQQLDGGNAWYQLARVKDGRFLWDFRQIYSSVFNWEFQAMNNQGLTPQQAMDKEFGQKGIPVELRPELVGDGPAAR
ncbi:hypothetical protein [Arthrobacter sp. 135MFCol5.1]|uniref:hypothetical protein n=1 Tax=Arthrobacter sp. 135MFCol5.1 TaxID=1158050 RepID=UPI00039D5096|nr:hypothetical protein [Arthrobacter sp. 135MFCol5.1]